MNLTTFAVSFFIFFIKKSVNGQLISKIKVCDFYFNDLTSVKPVLSDKNDTSKEIGCTINRPIPGTLIILLCPKKKGQDFSDLELVPNNCFTSHLYSPYTAGKNEKSIEKLDILPKFTHSISYDNHEAKFLYLPRKYKYRSNIYCRCDNKKTERPEDDKQKFIGKTGLVKIIMEENLNNAKNIDIKKSDNNIKLEENTKYVLDINYNDYRSDGQCDTLDFFSFNNSDGALIITTPSIFFSNTNCNLKIYDIKNNVYKIVLSANHTDVDGCDFTKPKGDGAYKRGFDLNSITEAEKICTVYIGSGKKNNIAGIKCPYTLTPLYCFRTVLYEKEIDNKMVFKTFLLSDILGDDNIEHYINLKDNMQIVGLPNKAENYAVIRCICENNGKKGIMELKIASSYTCYISLILLLIAIITLYL